MTDSFPVYPYDEDLIEASIGDGKSRVRVYTLNDTAVVLGSGSRPEQELDLDACKKDGVAVLRRRGGGCAVVLDPGSVIVSVVATGLPFGNFREQLEKLSAWLIKGLDRIGVPGVRHAGICDLVIGEKKVGGACLYRRGDLLYYSASLLVVPDMGKVGRYLKHPPREPDYRAGRSHESFMGSIGGRNLARGREESTVAAAGLPPDYAGGIDPDHLASLLRSTLQPPSLQVTAGVQSTRNC